MVSRLLGRCFTIFSCLFSVFDFCAMDASQLTVGMAKNDSNRD